jgi:hypothetical protein
MGILEGQAAVWLVWRLCYESKVVGSILEEVIGFLNWPNLSCRIITLRLTHPLTEIGTRNFSGGGVKGGLLLRATNSPPSVCCLSRKCGRPDVPQPYGPTPPVINIRLPCLSSSFHIHISSFNMVCYHILNAKSSNDDMFRLASCQRDSFQ